MSDPTKKQSLSISGQVLKVSETQKGTFMNSVLVDDRIYKFLSKENTHKVGSSIQDVPLSGFAIPDGFIGMEMQVR